jgi:hypothetical protein
MRRGKTILKWSLASAKLAYDLLATSAEILCRHSFGERYRLRLLASFGSYVLYALSVGAVMPDESPLVGFFLALYSLLLGYHLISIECRGYVRVHSYWTGTPWSMWARFGLGNGIVRILIEPGLMVIGGMTVSSRDPAISAWLQGAGFCLFFKEAIIALDHRRHALDAIDARFESERISEAIRRRTTPRTRNAQPSNRVTPASPQPQPSPSSQEMFNNLDPALRNLFGENERGSPPATPRPEGPLGHLPRIVSHRRRER